MRISSRHNSKTNRKYTFYLFNTSGNHIVHMPCFYQEVNITNKMSFSFPSSPPRVSGSFLERQFSTTIRGTWSPWTPQNKWNRNPLNPPARLSSLHSRLLSLKDPGRGLQAPHHINHSALTCLSLHAHQSELSSMLSCSHWMSSLQKYSHIEKCYCFIWWDPSWFDFNLKIQTSFFDNRYVFTKKLLYDA